MSLFPPGLRPELYHRVVQQYYARPPAQSGAFGFSGEVRSEDGIKLICRNSLTAVGNADFHARAAFAGRHANHAMLTNRLNSIEIEIQQDLSQPVRVGLNFR